MAAGIMLLWPFRIGDHIELPTYNIASRLSDMGSFRMQFGTSGRVFVFASNNRIWNGALRNQSRNQDWSSASTSQFRRTRQATRNLQTVGEDSRRLKRSVSYQ